jgi:multiple sugar transport system permease protein
MADQALDHLQTRAAGKRKQRSGMASMELRWGLIMGLPAMLGFLCFTIGPMLASGWISLTNCSISGSPEFIGLDNYTEMFRDDPLFYKSLRATFYYAALSVPLTLILSFLVAILLNQKVKLLSVFRTIFYLPVLVPAIANTILWLWLLNPDFGLANVMLEKLGLPTSLWLYDANTVIPSMALMAMWGFGGAMIIFLAGLQGVPQHLYESIEVDGGGTWARFRTITLPMMTPTIFFNLVMGIIGGFQAFTEAFIMTSGGPNNASLFYVLYLYRTAFTESRMGYASALAWLLFVVILVITILVFRSARSWVYYEGDRP